MSKKVSLKDAFVRSGAATDSAAALAAPAEPIPLAVSTSIQVPVDTSTQVPVHPASRPTVYPSIQPPPLPQKKKATFNLDASLHQRLKIAAAIHSREMVDIVEDALQAYLPALDQKAG